MSVGKWRKEKENCEIPSGINMTKPCKKALSVIVLRDRHLGSKSCDHVS